MISASVNVGKGVQWCLTIIHRQAINSRRKYERRWKRELPVLNQMTEQGTEWGNTIPSKQSLTDISNCETKLWLETLPNTQYKVLYNLIIVGRSQSETATELDISQQQVSRIKEAGIKKLRKGLLDHEEA